MKYYIVIVEKELGVRVFRVVEDHDNIERAIGRLGQLREMNPNEQELRLVMEMGV